MITRYNTIATFKGDGDTYKLSTGQTLTGLELDKLEAVTGATIVIVRFVDYSDPKFDLSHGALIQEKYE